MIGKHVRFLYQPVLPLGNKGQLVTGCNAHWNTAMEAATEGTVLLKNDGTLPLKPGAKICLFGLGAGDFLFGGGGSGWVLSSKHVTLADGLEAAAMQGKIEFFAPLVEYYKSSVKQLRDKILEDGMPAYLRWRQMNPMPMPVLPEVLYQQAVAFGDTAIFCVSRYTSESEENANGDRTTLPGDFYLWDEEKQLLDQICKDFSKVVVILNTYGPVSTVEYKNNPRVGAVLYPMYSGGIAGDMLTQMLLGDRYPSGHLQDTLANALEDYPSTAGFHSSLDHVDYTEDIFVGYRYFETFAPEKVSYPYGYGLGYTTFALSTVAASRENRKIKLEVMVKNTGSFAGKEVVQSYLSAPQGKLGKAKKVLCAFKKTKELAPGEETVVKLSFDIGEFGSFDDLGKIEKSAFILEKGEYIVHVGNNVRDTQQSFSFQLDENIICQRCHDYMAPRDLAERLTADGTMEQLPKAVPIKHKAKGCRFVATAPEKEFSLVEALQTGRTDEFIASLSDRELTDLLYGHAIVNPSSVNGIGMPLGDKEIDVKRIPLIPTADGPAGMRMPRGRGVSATYFPCENVVAQTWNLNLAKRVGTAIAKEVKENNIGIWLAPAMNIHRNPMGGRNFEYFSEDPLASGLFAASYVAGVQSQNIAATVKHYCSNNREYERKLADSRVSQRALREIYLRGFEIVVKKAKPWALMTSYNPVNGEQMSSNWEAINGILRGEWKYDGVVMTDWWVYSNIEDEICAGSDVKMPVMITRSYKGAPKSCDLAQLLTQGVLDRKAVIASVRRILRLMDCLE